MNSDCKYLIMGLSQEHKTQNQPQVFIPHLKNNLICHRTLTSLRLCMGMLWGHVWAPDASQNGRPVTTADCGEMHEVLLWRPGLPARRWGYWPLIGPKLSQDLDTGLWLVLNYQKTWILASDLLRVIVGLKDGYDCFCGDVLPPKQLAKSECDKKCNGNPNQTCGAWLKLSVYRREGNKYLICTIMAEQEHFIFRKRRGKTWLFKCY